MKTEYSMIFELMNEITIEIDSQKLAFFHEQGFPELNLKSSFNDYFFIIIVGFGFGIYNTYLIDTNIRKKFTLGLIRRNEIIYPKEGVYILEIIKFLLEKLKKMDISNSILKEKFSKGLIIWNISNFLMNLLNRFKEFHRFESHYEICLLDSFKTFGEFFKSANEEKMLILQALEIDNKMSILFKEHMRLLFNKKKKSLGLTKEMKAISTKFFFQKRLNELFEFPEKFKDRAFNSAEKQPEKLIDFSFKENILSEDIKKSIFNIQ